MFLNIQGHAFLRKRKSLVGWLVDWLVGRTRIAIYRPLRLGAIHIYIYIHIWVLYPYIYIYIYISEWGVSPERDIWSLCVVLAGGCWVWYLLVRRRRHSQDCSGWHSGQGSIIPGITKEISLRKDILGHWERLLAQNVNARLPGAVIWAHGPYWGNFARGP